MYKNFTKKLGVPKGYVHNFLRIMRLTTVILIATFMQVSAAGFAQRVTLNEHNASLENVLKEIRQQTGYDMIFDRQLVLKANPVNINVKDVSVDDALEKIIADQSLAFSIEDKTITIKEKVPTLLDKLKKALTPPTDIIGRVTNERGQPLNGATITIKRTQIGTLSDANGNFTVRNVSPTDTLIISYVGYKRAFIGIGNQTSLKVVLQTATNQLDQVVVQAYGETSQRLTTGDIGMITAKDIAKQPVTNVLQALQGQVPGAIITNNSGYASGTVKLEIRGRNTIGNFPSDPLYVIDGVPLTIIDVSNGASYTGGSPGFDQTQLSIAGQSPLFSLNPSDIESVAVLKDADATAIYGSRGSNGVVLITTKKGKAGKTHLDFNAYEGLSSIPRRYDLLNTQQYVQMRQEALKNDNLPVDIVNAPDLVAWGTTRYTDWQKELWGTHLGKNADVEASVSGGNSLTTFRISGGYHYLTEILTSSGASQRGSLSFNITHKTPDQKFSISLSGTYTYASINEINVPGSITTAPNAPPIYDNKGNLNFLGWQPLDGSFPFSSLLQPSSSSTNFLNSNVIFSYEILKGLKATANIGYNNSQVKQGYNVPIAAQDPLSNPPQGQANFGNGFFHNIIAEPQIEYNRFIKKGKLNVLVGASSQRSTTEALINIGLAYNNDALLGSISNAPIKLAFDNIGQYKYAAIFGRINYNWEDKYIINLNARRDGSSKFGPGRQFGNFGSIGGAWIFSEEGFIKDNLPFLSFGKIRGSYGTTGGDQISPYSYLPNWQFGAYSYNNVLPLNPLNHSNPLLHWQVNRKLEAALSLGFLKDRINVDASWYRDRCNDQLIPFPTPGFTGFTSVTANSPADVQNTGWEFTLNTKIVENSQFKWSAKLNIGINHNKLLSYPNLSQSPYANTYAIGQSLNSLKLLHFTGVDPQTGKYTYEDVNHNGQVDIDYSGKPDDRSWVDLSPKYDGGFTQNFSYKNFELSIFFYFRKQLGQNVYTYLAIPGTTNSNEPTEVLQRWQKPGDITNVAKFTTQPDQSYYNLRASDAAYTDASFIRLQNLSFSYTLPDKFVHKSGLSNCRFYIQGQNLFIITGYRGIDPEVQSFGVLPLPRIITAGISFNL